MKGTRKKVKKKKKKVRQGYSRSPVDKWMVALDHHSVCVDRTGLQDHSGGTVAILIMV